MKNNTEIEIKLVVSEENLERFFELEMVKKALISGSRRLRHLSSSYYDSKAMTLNKQGIAYRVRDKGDGSYEATVKTSKKAKGGFTERVEINIPLKDNTPILAGFQEQGLDNDLAALVPEGVVSLFTVNVDRITYLLAYDGARIELAIDKGYIVSSANPELKSPIDEIELELIEGETTKLLEFAERVKEFIPFKEESQSKYARGLALCNIDSKIIE